MLTFFSSLPLACKKKKIGVDLVVVGIFLLIIRTIIIYVLDVYGPCKNKKTDSTILEFDLT